MSSSSLIDATRSSHPEGPTHSALKGIIRGSQRLRHDKANRMTTLADKTQGYDKAGNLTLAYSTDRGTSYKYAYDPYGRVLIRESAGQADMDTQGDILTSAGSNDLVRFTDSMLGVIWDSRADMDNDGDVDQTDDNLRKTAAYGWYPSRNPVVAQALDMSCRGSGSPGDPASRSDATCQGQAFSDVSNPFGFQGRVHFAIDTLATATDGKLMLVDHRLRMNDPVTGRWTTRDPKPSPTRAPSCYSIGPVE